MHGLPFLGRCVMDGIFPELGVDTGCLESNLIGLFVYVIELQPACMLIVEQHSPFFAYFLRFFQISINGGLKFAKTAGKELCLIRVFYVFDNYLVDFLKLFLEDKEVNVDNSFIVEPYASMIRNRQVKKIIVTLK